VSQAFNTELLSVSNVIDSGMLSLSNGILSVSQVIGTLSMSNEILSVSGIINTQIWAV